jgi:hypothetical protein
MTNSNVSSIKEELCSVCLQALKSVAEDTHSDFNRRLSLLLLSQALKELSAADVRTELIMAVFNYVTIFELTSQYIINHTGELRRCSFQ